MTRLLLDSHAALWAFENAPALSRTAARAILAPANDIFVSPVSVYELSYKMTIGKLRALPDTFMALATAQGYAEIALTAAHADFAARLPNVHSDPWDRLLAAQALLENCTLVSRDRKLARLGAPMLW